MTLCAVWRDRDTLHIASDGGPSSAPDRPPDGEVRVTKGSFVIRGPEDGQAGAPVVRSGDIAFCFAGSGPGMVHLKQALTGMFGRPEATPGYDDIGFEGVARIAFSAYKVITRTLCANFEKQGFYRVVVAGRCYRSSSLRAFRFRTEVTGAADGVEPRHHMDEILAGAARHVFLGDGAPAARTLASQRTPPLSSREVLSIIHGVIADPVQIGAAGGIQYGRFEGADFRLFGVMDRASEAHLWRAAPDLREKHDGDFPIGYPMIPLDNSAP